MADSEIQCLKDNIDKIVEIETTSGELLIAMVLFVTHSEEYDEHELTYEMVRTNMPEFYVANKGSGGFVLNLCDIISARPFSGANPNGATTKRETRG